MPGIETADYEVVETGGTVEELAKTFDGAKVVCNCVGPFIYHGPTVAEACWRAGCHYIDIGGEQHWHREAAEKWSGKFAERGLLIAPATAFMSTPSDIAARMCAGIGGGGYAGNPDHVQRHSDVRVDADHFCRNSNGRILPGAEPVQAVAARYGLRRDRSGFSANATGADVGRIPASGVVQGPSANRERAQRWAEFWIVN